MPSAEPDEAIIVGASLAGLCAAWQLKKRGLERITVIERGRIGHRKGASHGRSRLLSCVGFTAPIQPLIRLSRDEGWSELQHDLGRKVTKRLDGVAVGPLSKAFHAGVQNSFGVPGEVTPLTLPVARRTWPQLTLTEGMGTVRDASSMLIASETATDLLLAWLQREGVSIVPNTEVLSVHSTADGLWLETNRGRRVAERVVVTAGRGTPHLFERAASRIKSRAVVSVFFSLDIPEAEWRAGIFPPVRVLNADGEVEWTVLPEFADRGVKVTRHSMPVAEQTTADLKAMRDWFENTFAMKVDKQLGRELRHVVRVEDRPLLIDTHHDDPRLVFATGFDGAEVVLAPIVGRILSELLLDGRSKMAEFQRNRKFFALPRRGLPSRRKRRPGKRQRAH